MRGDLTKRRVLIGGDEVRGTAEGFRFEWHVGYVEEVSGLRIYCKEIWR